MTPVYSGVYMRVKALDHSLSTGFALPLRMDLIMDIKWQPNIIQKY